MPKNTSAEETQEAPLELPDDASPYDVPSELDEPTILDDPDDEPSMPPRRPASLKLAVGVALVLLVGAALLAYRAHHRRKVVTAGLAKAGALLRLDTAAGYRAAASLLEPIAELDPTEAASVRAFALAMLFADYRETGLEADVEALLVGPVREEVVPSHAHLATAALALGRREAGTATTALARAGDLPWARALQARVAFLAGNVPAALEPAAEAAAHGGFAAGLALRGDALRRLRQDPAGARAAYEAALAASPVHPRAAYGLAKLALSDHAPAAGAAAALERVAGDDGTPGPERARAAIHLAALRLRSGDRAGADASLDAAGLAGPARSWAERAAAVEAENRGPYRAVLGAPAALQSASDDDPPVLSPNPPPPPPKVEPRPARAAKKSAAKPAKRATAKKAAPKKAPARKQAAKKPPARRTTARR